MPSWLVRGFSRMLNVLQAQEALQRINEMAYAFGSMTQQDSSKYRSALEGQATGTRRSIRRPKTPMEMAMLAGATTKIGSGP